MAENSNEGTELKEVKLNSKSEALIQKLDKPDSLCQGTIIREALAIDKIRRSWWDRTFSKMEAGSMRGSILTLIATSIGAGVLTLPYLCKMSGFFSGLLMITTGMLASLWSLYLLIASAESLNTKQYYQICEKTGGRILGLLFHMAVFVEQSGAVIGYQIISKGR